MKKNCYILPYNGGDFINDNELLLVILNSISMNDEDMVYDLINDIADGLFEHGEISHCIECDRLFDLALKHYSNLSSYINMFIHKARLDYHYYIENVSTYPSYIVLEIHEEY